MLKNVAIVFGFVLLGLGILGFIPAATPNGYLLGFFHVNTAHNLIHVATGLIALWCGFTSFAYSQLFFRVFGAVYGLVAILGFIYGDTPIFGIIANNIADAWLHVAIAAFSLYLGFVYPEVD